MDYPTVSRWLHTRDYFGITKAELDEIVRCFWVEYDQVSELHGLSLTSEKAEALETWLNRRSTQESWPPWVHNALTRASQQEDGMSVKLMCVAEEGNWVPATGAGLPMLLKSVRGARRSTPKEGEEHSFWDWFPTPEERRWGLFKWVRMKVEEQKTRRNPEIFWTGPGR